MSELSYGAVHVRETDRVALIDNLHAALGASGFKFRPGGKEASARDARRFLLMPPSGGWTTVLPEDPTWARELAKDLATAGAPTIALVHVDDDLAFGYEAYARGGTLLDAYHSCPDAEKAFDEADSSEAELARTKGDPQKLAGAFGLAAELFAEAAPALAEARIENLRDHDPIGAKYGDCTEPRRLLMRALGLPELEEGFPELWDLGLFEEAGPSDAELRALVYGPTKEKKRGLRGLLSRFSSDDDEEDEDLDENESADDKDDEDDEPLDDELEDEDR